MQILYKGNIKACSEYRNNDTRKESSFIYVTETPDALYMPIFVQILLLNCDFWQNPTMKIGSGKQSLYMTHQRDDITNKKDGLFGKLFSFTFEMILTLKYSCK